MSLTALCSQQITLGSGGTACASADSVVPREFGQQSFEGWQLSFHLTHQDLAELTGLTRVTVTRLLNDFDRQGLIQRENRLISLIGESADPFWHYEI